MTDIATQVRIFDSDPDDDLVVKRTAAINDLASRYGKGSRQVAAILQTANDIAAALEAKGKVSDAMSKEVENAVRKGGAEAFVATDQELQVKVCAGVAALQLLGAAAPVAGDVTASVFLAVGLWSALSFQAPLNEPKLEALRSELLNAAHQHVIQSATSSRQRTKVPDINVAAPEPLDPANVAKAVNSGLRATFTRVARLVENTDVRPATRDLMRWATARTASPARIAESLVILDSASPNVRFSVASCVDELSDRLVHRHQADLGRRAYDAWARLIAAGSDISVRFRAASLSLTFALHQPRLPVSSLILVSFPIVYAQLLRSKEADDRTIPAFIALPISFFVDWDRAKSARRDLVDAYLTSTWPPADLLLTAIESGIASDTLDRLSRTNTGQEYIGAIQADVARLDEPTRMRVHESLTQFFTSQG